MMKIFLLLFVVFSVTTGDRHRQQRVINHDTESSNMVDSSALLMSLTDDGLTTLYGDEASECLADDDTDFPSDDILNSLNDTVFNEIRAYGDEQDVQLEDVEVDIDDERDNPKPKPKPKPCKACCKIGAYAGKKYRHKGKCPVVECRRLFKKFYKKYKKYVKHPFRCGFAFVKCCVRVHYKELYSPVQPLREIYDWSQHRVQPDAIQVEMVELNDAISGNVPAQPVDTYKPPTREQADEIVDDIIHTFI